MATASGAFADTVAALDWAAQSSISETAPLDPVRSAVVAAPASVSGVYTATSSLAAVAKRSSSATRASRSRMAVRVPLVGPISARFGSRGRRWAQRHTGIDISAPYGTKVRAVTAGTVVKIAYDREYGRTVVLRGGGVDTWYAHLSSARVLVGARVLAGRMIGRVGTSGNVTGPHLHLEVRAHDEPTDPASFLWGRHAGMPGRTPAWARAGVTALSQL